MSNHVHLIVRVRNNEHLSSVLRDVKRYSAKVIDEILKEDQHESSKHWLLWIVETRSSNVHFKVWRHENHSIALYRNNMLEEGPIYIHLNPLAQAYALRLKIIFIPVLELMLEQ